MSNFISISDARAILPDLINKISKNMDRATITVNGKPKAVVLSFDELESLEETAEFRPTPGALESIRKGKKQIENGQFVMLADLK